MRTIIHISDLHFGRTNPYAIEPLISKIKSLKPDLIIVSGDLTQRAKRVEFEQAKKFLDTLGGRQLIIPGNHDIPLYNVIVRFLQPLQKYKTIISTELEPTFVDKEIAVLGLNTARSLVLSGGRINKRQRELLETFFKKLPKNVFKILVTHHPFDFPVGYTKLQIVRGAKKMVPVVSRLGVDLILSGHLHASMVKSVAARYGNHMHPTLLVHAGTALSTRLRKEQPSFNRLTIDKGVIGVERFIWNEKQRKYALHSKKDFARVTS